MNWAFHRHFSVGIGHVFAHIVGFFAFIEFLFSHSLFSFTFCTEGMWSCLVCQLLGPTGAQLLIYFLVLCVSVLHMEWHHKDVLWTFLCNAVVPCVIMWPDDLGVSFSTTIKCDRSINGAIQLLPCNPCCVFSGVYRVQQLLRGWEV